MYHSYFKKYTFQFKHPSGTSRGVLTEKVSWFVFLFHDLEPDTIGIGECSPLEGLSIDDRMGYEDKLVEVCGNIDNYLDQSESLSDYPSIRFGIEMALLDYQQRGRRILFPSAFTEGNDSILINGLVWMGSFEAMLSEVNL